MKRLISLIVALVFCFFSSWLYKIKTPVQRPDEFTGSEDLDAGAWWNTSALKAKSEEWTLDPTIPLNYIPVPGEEELYMVVDNNGKVIKYRKRVKQMDGSWEWEDVNPDIPDNYEPVPGLENVYKVTDENGNVKYYKYIRNDDDTYAFVEVDKNGKEIGKNTDATKIDGKHVHITGNVYQRLDSNGVVIGYDKRVANADGTFSWIDTPDPTAGSDSMLDQLQSEWSLDSGSNGQGGLQVPQLDTSDMDAMAAAMAQASAAGGGGDQVIVNITNNGGGGGVDYTPVIVNNPDGTHTEERIYRETKNVDGNLVTYETYVKNTYDAKGELIKTDSEGPYAVDSTMNMETEKKEIKGDTSQKRDTIAEESARVTVKFNYNNDVAERMFALLNAQRAENNIPKLTASSQLCQLAMLRAADMATYDTSTQKLPTYGSLGTMMSQYKVAAKKPGENMWKTIDRSADDIHTRLQAVDASRTTRMDKDLTEYGAAIVEYNGNMYICEIVN